MTLQCGLLGKTLGHSYSPAIHAQLGDYAYALYEIKEQKLASFLQDGIWDGLNVTIPYKKAVLPYLTELSDTARRIGSVNTVVRRSDGTLYGDNTDYDGFLELVRYAGICAKGKKVLVLGNGGAAAAVVAALKQLQATPVVISRSGENNYKNLDRHSDAQLIVNTTPLGMFPDTGKAAVDLTCFPQCSGVLDLIYNPARTALLLQAEQLEIPCANGLYMLVAQAKRSAELFTNTQISDAQTERVHRSLSQAMQNIVLVGMPGCGKSTVAARLAAQTGRRFFDSDVELTRKTGKTPAQLLTEQGETVFRDLECEILSTLGKQSGVIIATGGGAVLREENYAALHQNGTIVWLQRPLCELSCEGRPLSQHKTVERLYDERREHYRRFADVTVPVCGDAETTAQAVLSVLEESL